MTDVNKGLKRTGTNHDARRIGYDEDGTNYDTRRLGSEEDEQIMTHVD